MRPGRFERFEGACHHDGDFGAFCLAPLYPTGWGQLAQMEIAWGNWSKVCLEGWGAGEFAVGAHEARQLVVLKAIGLKANALAVIAVGIE